MFSYLFKYFNPKDIFIYLIRMIRPVDLISFHKLDLTFTFICRNFNSNFSYLAIDEKD